METSEPAIDAGVDQELEDRLSGSLNSDPAEEEGGAADPDFDAWFRAKERDLEDAWLVTETLAGETW